MSATRSPITTHVLDLARGRPAAGVAVSLLRKEEGTGWREVGRGTTDADGRARDLLPAGATVSAGTYQLRFDTLSYFKENPPVSSSSLSFSPFFPEITITFVVTDPPAHHHVPLLLSPFGYSTYRGS
jgi:5-hydroxyisourate hydrolase